MSNKPSRGTIIIQVDVEGEPEALMHAMLNIKQSVLDFFRNKGEVRGCSVHTKGFDPWPGKKPVEPIQ
jgi:hypothetical protein